MNKSELATQLTRYTNLTSGQAYDAISALGCAVVDEVKQGGCVAIPGFGLFEPGTKASGELFLAFRQHKSLRSELNTEKPGFKQGPSGGNRAHP